MLAPFNNTGQRLGTIFDFSSGLEFSWKSRGLGIPIFFRRKWSDSKILECCGGLGIINFTDSNLNT